MTEERIYQLAWRAALDRWFCENERAERTKSRLSKKRAEKAWKELNEIEALIYEKGFNQWKEAV